MKLSIMDSQLRAKIRMKFRVKIRRDLAEVRPEAEIIDGKVYNFSEGWIIDSSLYDGEIAMIPRDLNYPDDAPAWIAAGDLIDENKLPKEVIK